MAAGRFAAEVVIERDDAVHIGARKVQRFRDDRHRGFRHAAELVLRGVRIGSSGPSRPT
jgi:hypothetical protein